MGPAMEIGVLETLGYGWQSSPLMLNRLNQVTQDDVQRVAQSYFKDDQLTVARLVPQPLDAAEQAARAKRAETVQAGGRH